MTEWIAIALAIVGPSVGIYAAYRATEAVGKRRWVEMDGIIKQFRDNHTVHFTHAGKTDSDIARLEQSVEDHEKHDEERFDRIEAMFKEIRESLRRRNEN